MTADTTVASILDAHGFERPPERVTAPPLEFFTMAELIAAVIAEGDPRFLIRGLWPAGAYGVYAAEPKAGKTWGGCDAAVAVASGKPWLGMIPTDVQGPVLMFVGEGGKRNILRRLRAVAEFHQVDLVELPIVVCPRVPHLSTEAHMAIVRQQIDDLRPVLVDLDPLYLAARGNNGSQLYEMGAALEEIQQTCEPRGAALLVVTHWNRKEGRGSARITGAGPAEWGRVLLSAGVRSRHTDPVSKRTRVVVDMDCTGGEIADQTIRFVREVWTDDPDDLGSAMHYTVTEAEDVPETEEGASDLRPAARLVLSALRSKGGDWWTVQEIGDYTAHAGHPYKKRTIQDALKALAERNLVLSMEQLGGGGGRYRAGSEHGL